MNGRPVSPQMRRIQENEARRRTEGGLIDVEIKRVLREEAAVGELAGSGSAAADLTPLLGEPERAATSPSTSREYILDAIRRWADLHDGVPPKSTEWSRPDRGDYPSTNTVIHRFGKWSTAIREAGLDAEHHLTPRRQPDSGREPRGDDADPVVAPRAATPPAETLSQVSPGPSAAAPAKEWVPTPSRPDAVVAVRDPIRTADIPYDADILESEATFLRNRAAALEQIAGGIRKLAELAA